MKKDIILKKRDSGEFIKETIMGDRALRFAYETLLGNCISGLLFNTSGLSRVLGLFYDSKLSRRSISSLTSIPGCMTEEAEFPPGSYNTFNDFFTRKLKPGIRPFDSDEKVLSSPADGRIMVYENLEKNAAVPVKGAQRTIHELCGEELPFESMAAAVVRLAPVDYHRFHFPCDCTQQSPVRVIKGKYHSVSPVSLRKIPDIYTENTRHITDLLSKNFGSFRYLEIGAFGVGSIIQSASGTEHCKLAEKGYFKFGGSTVILLFDNSKLQWSADLLENSKSGYETMIRCGETIASAR